MKYVSSVGHERGQTICMYATMREFNTVRAICIRTEFRAHNYTATASIIYLKFAIIKVAFDMI